MYASDQSSTLETMLYFSEYLLVLPRLIIVCCDFISILQV